MLGKGRISGTSNQNRIRGNLELAALLAGFIGGWDASASFFVFPDIRDNFAGGDAAAASWVLTVTNIVGAALLLQSGRLTDKSGPQRLYKFGVQIFVIGVVLSTIAPTLWFLIIARGLSAASQALMGPAAIALVIKYSGKGRESEAVGRWGFYTAVAGAISPLIVTQLISTFTWRSLFALQIPIGLFVLYCLSGVELPNRGDSSVTIKPLDSVITISGLTLIILPIVKADNWGISSVKTLSFFLTGFFLLIVLVKKSSESPSSPLQLQLFKNRNFICSSIMSLFAGIAFYAHWMSVLLFMTEIWDYSIVKAGLILTIMPGSMSLFSISFGRISDNYGFRWVIIPGILVYSLLFLFLWLWIGPNESMTFLVPALVGSGIGMATVWPTLTAIGASGTEESLLGSATSVIHTIQRVGGALGIAIVLAIIGSVGEAGSFEALRAGLLVMPMAGAVTFICGLFLGSRS